MNREEELVEIINRNWSQGDEVGLFTEVKSFLLAQEEKIRGEMEERFMKIVEKTVEDQMNILEKKISSALNNESSSQGEK